MADLAAPNDELVSRVRIVSGGTGASTRVYVDGVLLDVVLSVSWQVSAQGSASAVITVDPVTVDVQSDGPTYSTSSSEQIPSRSGADHGLLEAGGYAERMLDAVSLCRWDELPPKVQAALLGAGEAYRAWLSEPYRHESPAAEGPAS